MIDNQFHNDPTLCNDPANFNYNCNHVSPYMSMNELNKLKYNSNTLSVLQLNGRSIVKNFDNLKLLLNSIHNKFEVISICETWFNKFNMNLFGIYRDIPLFIILEITKKLVKSLFILRVHFLQIKLSFYLLVTFTLIQLL